jgi:hypothetical protein
MLVVHLGNIGHCELSLQTSSSVKCFNHSVIYDAQLRVETYAILIQAI